MFRKSLYLLNRPWEAQSGIIQSRQIENKSYFSCLVFDHLKYVMKLRLCLHFLTFLIMLFLIFGLGMLPFLFRQHLTRIFLILTHPPLLFLFVFLQLYLVPIDSILFGRVRVRIHKMPCFLYLLHPFERSFPIGLFCCHLLLVPILFLYVLALDILIAADEITQVYYLFGESVELVGDRLYKSFFDFSLELLYFRLEFELGVFYAL